jgi:hypothetical protein
VRSLNPLIGHASKGKHFWADDKLSSFLQKPSKTNGILEFASQRVPDNIGHCLHTSLAGIPNVPVGHIQLEREIDPGLGVVDKEGHSLQKD